MDDGTKNLCVEDIREAIKILNGINVPQYANLNVRNHTWIPIPNTRNKVLCFMVTALKVNLGGTEIPAEYAITFDSKEHKVRLRKGKLIVKLKVLEAFARYLKK